MSWTEYHQGELTVPFGNQSGAYKRALEGLREMKTDPLESQTATTIVLGGFHNPWSVADFHKLCDQLQTGPQRRILMDLNRAPLNLLEERRNPNRVQARLERLPFQKNSIDLIFLDYTTDFISDSNLKAFSTNINDLLKPTGLVLAAFIDTQDASYWRLITASFAKPVPIHMRSRKKFSQLMAPLNPVVSATFPTPSKYGRLGSLTVFARSDSAFPQFKGKLFVK